MGRRLRNGVAVRLLHLTVAVAAATSLGGCITAQPMRLGLVTPAIQQTEGRIIALGVSATDCPQPGYMYGDFNNAVNRALATVEGADALINVTLEVKDTFGHYCLRVTGDAVAL